jgi:hypothetical protein
MENWKTIPDFPNYSVSDMGRVKRVTGGYGATPGRILKGGLSLGYLRVPLYRGDGTLVKFFVHRLVAKAFVHNPDPEHLVDVNHMGDGAKTDNRAVKLEWRSKAGHGQDTALRNQKGDGVRFNKRHGKWYGAYSPEPNKEVHIGSFNTHTEALVAVTAAKSTITVMMHRTSFKPRAA